MFNKLDNEDKTGHIGVLSGGLVDLRQCTWGKFRPKLLAVT